MHIPELAERIQEADYHDVHSIRSDKPLPAFIASMLSYMPGWMRFLYHIRAGFVRLLGMRQDRFPGDVRIHEKDVSFVPGDKVGFLTVATTREDAYWLGEASDKHLAGYLGVVLEKNSPPPHTYHAVTIVKYRHWTGPVYFNVIRPMHHVVVMAMLRQAAKPKKG